MLLAVNFRYAADFLGMPGMADFELGCSGLVLVISALALTAV